jgi:hypothetical protein
MNRLAASLQKGGRRFNAEAQQLFDRWRKLSPRRRAQAIFALCAFMTIFYTLIIYPAGHNKLETLRYREEKLNVRIKNSSGGSFTPGKQDKDELSLEQANRELAKIKTTLDNLKKEEQRLLARFVALDDLEGLQVLKSALAQLAESGDMEILAIEHIYARDGRDATPSREQLLAAGRENPYKRPLLRLKARAGYRGLMRFLAGLSEMPYIAAPVWSDIHTDKRPANARNNADNLSERLEVEIHLAI